MKYVNIMQNIIKFKIKAGYYLEFLTPETMILLGGNKSKVTKDKNDENVPILGITKIVLVYSYIVNNGYQQDSRVLHTFIPNK